MIFGIVEVEANKDDVDIKPVLRMEEEVTPEDMFNDDALIFVDVTS
jgi:hypothetical protein